MAEETVSSGSLKEVSLNALTVSGTDLEGAKDSLLADETEQGKDFIDSDAVSENEGFTVSENGENDPEEGEEARILENGNSEAALSENSASENAASEDMSDLETAVSENSVSENEALIDIDEYILSANEALKKLGEDKIIPAVIVLCDEYGLRKEPGEDSEVETTLPVGTTVYPREVAFKDGSFWFRVVTYVNEKEYSGYVLKNNLIYVDSDLIAWEKVYLDVITNALKAAAAGETTFSAMSVSSAANEGNDIQYVAQASISSFPATYQSALTSLSARHSNWVFVPQNTGVSFSAALAGELSDKNKNWIYHTAPASYKNGVAASNWYYASQSCLEYYMDPRNFLTEKYIFQFETLNYNSSYQTAAGVQKFLNSTFMKGLIPDDSLTYAEAFAKTGAAHQVSPYHLAARVYQEQGVNGTSDIISGRYSGYEGYYNYFNIQASGSDPVLNGLKYAKSQGWNTRYKSLDGGAEFLGSSYINRGQDTLYTQKYNVASSSSRFSHQYMQNAQAAATEAAALYNIYNGAGSLNDAFIFKIPVYTDMSVPAEAGSEEAVSEALKVRPQVKLQSVRAVNLFGTGIADMGICRISTDGRIVSVSDNELSVKAQSSSPGIVVDHTSGNLVYLKAVNVNKSNISRVSKNVKLSITLDGFEAADYSFNAVTKTVRPSFKVRPAVIYAGLGSGEARITDSSGAYLSLPEDTSVTSTASDIKLSMGADKSSVIITPVNASSFKAGSRNITFSSSAWNSDITYKVSIKKSSKPVMALSEKTVIFNKKLSDAKHVVMYSVDGSSLSVNKLDIEGGNDKSRNALASGQISAVKSSDGKLTLGFSGSASSGSYTLRLTGTIDNFGGSAYTMKTVNLTVKVEDKTPDQIVGIAQKGKINLVNRGGTDVLYTLKKLKQIGAESITAVSLEGTNSAYFTAGVIAEGYTDANGYTVTDPAGAIAVYANETAALSHKTTYALPLKITLDNGYVLTKTVKIRPANSYAKLKPLLDKVTLTRGGSAVSCYFKSTGAGNDNTLIASAELMSTDKNSKYFSCQTVTTTASKLYGVKLAVSDATMKPGKYTLKFNVYPKGSSTAVNPVRVSVKVTVK
ncbi:MAG: hypothetical protein IJU93_02375 [Lachnospiraceae bacterium]|nr:hypothetical protein [Lachnospiraceae bacterium]